MEIQLKRDLIRLTQNIVNAQLLNISPLPFGHPELRGVVLVVVAGVRSGVSDNQLQAGRQNVHVEHERIGFGGNELLEASGGIGNLIEWLGLGRVRTNIDCAFEAVIQLHFLH